jgi:hypothetical protein
MNSIPRIAAIAVFLALSAPLARAQQNPPPTPALEFPNTLLRVQVIISEYEGEKKISSLPYILDVSWNAHSSFSSLRTGLRVPIAGASKDAQITYIDTGTSIDCSPMGESEGLYLMRLSADRSWPAVSGEANRTANAIPSNLSFGPQPIIEQFRAELNLALRDGQTVTSTVATDPVSGHIIKIDVTLNEVK